MGPKELVSGGGRQMGKEGGVGCDMTRSGQLQTYTVIIQQIWQYRWKGNTIIFKHIYEITLYATWCNLFISKQKSHTSSPHLTTSKHFGNMIPVHFSRLEQPTYDCPCLVSFWHIWPHPGRTSSDWGVTLIF